MSQKNILTKQSIVAVLAFISCALWGSAFAAVKTGYALLEISNDDWASQLAFGGLRFAVAGLMVLVYGSIQEKRLLLPRKEAIPCIGIISLFQTILQYFCYYIGLAHTTGVKASVLVGMNVFVAIVISSLVFRQEKMDLRKTLGSLVGMLGIILINLDGLRTDFSFRMIGDGLILLCTIASGFSSSFMRRYSVKENPILLSGWQFLFGGIVLMLIGLAGGGSLANFTLKALAMLIYLAFVSAAAYSLWATLLKYNPVSVVSVYGFLNPVCGVLISAVVLHEGQQIRGAFLPALLCVCAGIIIVNIEQKDSK
ncbi:MAG: DMT family transporter [Oscillospiraceae bacterium]|nr:DMT family transporter [Oscillospiraceae bacterium]